MGKNTRSALRQIPSVESCLQDARLTHFLERLPRSVVVDCIRQSQAEQRELMLDTSADAAPAWQEERFFSRVLGLMTERIQGYLRPVINATGIIVHTNLGRSILSDSVVERVKALSSTYTNLEYDLQMGKRSSRYDHLVPLLRRLTGYEDSLIVNNNAAAVLLLLDTFAPDKEVIISRGELVEIGGGFRIPEVMKKAGVILVEVGCTNKTSLSDYEAAITSNTAMILKVHRSNFHMHGFTAEPSLEELGALARKNKLMFMFDLGSGNLLPTDFPVHIDEPSIRSCQPTVDILTFSGDKLLGGPQAGVILASSPIIDSLKKNQLLRALRVDKMCIAALEATLQLYLYDTPQLVRNMPTLRMLSESMASIKARSEKMVEAIRPFCGNDYDLSIQPGHSQLGGGGLPGEQFPTALLALVSRSRSLTDLEQAFRNATPPIICRIANDCLLFDLRTVQPNEETVLIEVFKKVLAAQGNMPHE
ncbi:L-seryl-tRNA(Sec) selenium transferase [bacterium]|nr:L-seryl-tRNA(Sec) selenium transferase [bacterium]